MGCQTRKQIALLRDMFGNRCHYCKEDTNNIKNHPRMATKEHVVPRSYGGQNIMGNYVLACSECNNRRGTSLLYCDCTLCSTLIGAAMDTPEFINGIFSGIIAHNTPHVYKYTGHHPEHLNKWTVKFGHNRQYFATWEQAMNHALTARFVARSNG